MYVLHAHWHPPTRPTEMETAGVLFWAESSDGPPPLKIKSKKSAVQPHPFCAAPELLKPLLAGLEAEVTAAERKKVVLLLPTTKFGPQPSPQLGHDWDILDRAPPGLAPWLLAGLWLPPASAFRLLLQLANPEKLAPHLAWALRLNIGRPSLIWCWKLWPSRKYCLCWPRPTPEANSFMPAGCLC